MKPDCPEGTAVAPAVAPAPPRPVTVEPLTAAQARLHMTVSPAFLAKLEAARLALSHSLPGASAEEVLSAGLDLLQQRDAKRKGPAERPRPAPPEECAEPGGVCGSRLRLQLDHRVSRAEGGPPTVANVRVLCSAHNKLAARERLGDRLMDRYCHDPRQVELGNTASPGSTAAEPGTPSLMLRSAPGP